MQDPRPPRLRHNTRQKRRHRPTRTAHGADHAQRADLHPSFSPSSSSARQVPGKHRRGAGIDGPEQEADDGDEEGVAERLQAWHEPDQELGDEGAEDQERDGDVFAEEVGGVREREAAEGDAGPETCVFVLVLVVDGQGHEEREGKGDKGGRERGSHTSSNVTNPRWIPIPVIDEERNNPSGNRDFGALISEDEQRTQNRRPVAHGPLEQLHFRRLGRCRGCTS